MEQEVKKGRYTKGEEIFNAVSHIVAASLVLVGLIVGVVLASLGGSSAWAIVSFIVYCVCAMLAFIASSIYHFLRQNRAKRLFRIFDHCAIFLLIAGTYTPICLVILRDVGAWGWTLFGILWFMAIVGIVLKSLFMNNKLVTRIGMITYLVMGWCAVIAIYPLLGALHPNGFWLLVAGGIVYTLGAVVYLLGKVKKRRRYIHSVWHLFVLVASILHYFAILFYVLLY